MPSSFQYPVERHRDLQRRWGRLPQRTRCPPVPQSLAEPPPGNATLQWHFRRRVSTELVGTMVEARWLEMMVSSDHPLADERVAEAIARVLSRYWVDTASGVELIMSGVELIITHRGANIAWQPG